MKKDSLIAEYLIVCRNVFDEKPEILVSKIAEIKDRIHEGIKKEEKVIGFSQKIMKSSKTIGK